MAFLIAVGHTGGHVYPALCLARELQRRDPTEEVHFVGTPGGFSRWGAASGSAVLEIVRAAPLRGGSAGTIPRGLLALPTAFRDAGALLRRLRPRVVIGAGSYVSGPVLASARLLGIPTLLLEPNVYPGLANRLLATSVDAAAVGWDATARFYGRKAFVSGTPVRPELAVAAGPRATSDLRVLVLGGSQGSAAVNDTVRAALPELARARACLSFRHQSGEDGRAGMRAAYADARFTARVEAFIEAMDEAYAGCDVVVSAAGAITCAELAAVGRPAVLVPLPVAARHQEHNARAMAASGATLTVLPGADSGPRLAHALLELASSQRRAEMASKARTLARPEAASAIVDRLLELAR